MKGRSVFTLISHTSFCLDFFLSKIDSKARVFLPLIICGYVCACLSVTPKMTRATKTESALPLILLPIVRHNRKSVCLLSPSSFCRLKKPCKWLPSSVSIFISQNSSVSDWFKCNTCIRLSSCYDAFLFPLNVLSDADFWDGSIEGIVPRRTVTSASCTLVWSCATPPRFW